MPEEATVRRRFGLPGWMLPVVWMAVIMMFSTEVGSAESTGRLLIPFLRWAFPGITADQAEAVHHLGRKAAHFTEYAVLAALWFRALARGGRRSPARTTWLVLAIVVGWAAVDEIHQLFVHDRVGSVADVALDTAGAATALALATWGRRAVDVAITVLLWVAAAGGILALAVNLYTGVSSGFLWVSVPGAVLTLVVRRHQWRASRPPRPARP